jgi:Zn finger protein HypA/HybF involved in hydrogenase expression
MSLERLVFDRLVAVKTAAVTFADVVAVANTMTAEEKAEFAKTLMKDDCKACNFLSVRVKNKIKSDATTETQTIINDDTMTLAEIKTTLNL